MIDAEARGFIGRSPFLFVGSRGGDGRFDLSPRGDDPCVLTSLHDGTLLLPDRAGNNRIDTLRNVLDSGELHLALIAVNENRYLQLRATARISRESELLKPFTVRGETPQSVLQLSVQAATMVPSLAFTDGGFWSPSNRGVAPMQLREIIESQIAYHGGKHVTPGERAEMRAVYPPLEKYVKGKAFPRFDPFTREFLATTRFAGLAFAEGILFVGGAAGFAESIDAEHVRIRSRVLAGAVLPGAGSSVGGLFVYPGRNETLRLNGSAVSCEPKGEWLETVLRTEEIYFHCANALARSRIWRPKAALAWNGVRRFVCRSRIEECRGVVSFVLSPEDDAPLLPFKAGQYVTVAAPEDATCPVESRCYSLSTSPGGDSFRITVRQQGAMSAWLQEQVQPGSRVLKLGAPRGRFILDESSPRTPVLIGAGVGVTPLISMLEHLTNAVVGRPVWLIHGVRNGQEHAMRAAVENQRGLNSGLRTHIVYSRPKATDRQGIDYDAAGRIDIATVEPLVDLQQSDFYLCGPSDFMVSLKQALLLRGVPAARIRMELFGAEATSVQSWSGTTPDASAPLVTFTRSGRSVRWHAGAGSLLNLALGNSLDAPYLCRSGDCQSCMLKLEGGEVAYPEDVDVLPPEGYVLMCQAQPVSDVKIEL